MTKKIINTDQAPAAIGAYSQAVVVDNTAYVSGQIPLDPQSMEVVASDFAGQAHQVFANLIAVSSATGGSLADAVKLNVYMTDLGDFAELNSIMSEYMEEPFPARAAVQVAALPKGVKIEIDAVLHLG